MSQARRGCGTVLVAAHAQEDVDFDFVEVHRVVDGDLEVKTLWMEISVHNTCRGKNKRNARGKCD
tara:strand:- start:129 stop:323 length:195 start_codon:yes stop_codon:yes gene_type:complete